MVLEHVEEKMNMASFFAANPFSTPVGQRIGEFKPCLSCLSIYLVLHLCYCQISCKKNEFQVVKFALLVRVIFWKLTNNRNYVIQFMLFSFTCCCCLERATDEKLASEDWALNLEICDIINETDEGWAKFIILRDALQCQFHIY